MLIFSLITLSAAYTEICQHRQTHPHQLGEPFAQRVTQYERDVHHRMKGVDLAHDLRAPWNNEGNRYLVYRPHEGAGLGNRMLGLASAWILSLLTDRIFLVASTWQVDWNELFCEPILGASWLWPLGMEWFQGRLNDDLTVRLNRYYPVPVKMASINLDHQRDTRAYKALVCRGDLRDEWWMVQTIVVSSNQWFVPLLLSNPNYRVKLQEWFPEGDIFSQIMTYLFHPANTVWQRLQTKSHSLAIHLRYLSPDTNHVPAALRCIKQHSLNTEQVFLATMDRHSHQQLSQHYNVTYEGDFTPSQQLFTTDAFKSALLDMLTLSQASDLILSPASTMGYIAQALSQRRAWLLDAAAQGGCTRHRSHEPCFHVGVQGVPKNVCHGPGFPVKSILREPTIDSCPDFTGGWQMQVDYAAVALRKLNKE